jgi:hypothetical protein
LELRLRPGPVATELNFHSHEEAFHVLQKQRNISVNGKSGGEMTRISLKSRSLNKDRSWWLPSGMGVAGAESKPNCGNRMSALTYSLGAVDSAVQCFVVHSHTNKTGNNIGGTKWRTLQKKMTLMRAQWELRVGVKVVC